MLKNAIKFSGNYPEKHLLSGVRTINSVIIAVDMSRENCIDPKLVQDLDPLRYVSDAPKKDDTDPIQEGFL